MSVLVMLGVAVAVAAVVALMFLVGLWVRRPAAAADGALLSTASDLALRRARQRALLCVTVGVVVLVGGAVLNAAVPDLLGLPIALAPGLAAAAALFGYAALPVTIEPPSGPTSASLAPRTAWSYGSRRAFAVPGTISAATLGFLTWAAVVADPDEQGRMRAVSFADGPVSTSAGPFPGSFYGLPLALVTVVLAASTYLALRRIAGIPTLPRPTDAVADRSWRATSTDLVIRVANAALLGYLGGAAFFAGHATHSASSGLESNGGHLPGVVLGGTLLAIAGAALVLAGLVNAFRAVGQALTLRSASAARTPAYVVSPPRG